VIDSARILAFRWAREPGLWIVAAATALYACVVVPYWQPTWDSATYITLAKSLVSGDGYTYMGYDHTKYPPGFPLMLAPIVAMFGRSFLLMRCLEAACAVAAIGVAYALLRRAAGVGIAAAAATMTAASYALLFEATRILSDLPYMLVSLVALLAIERLRLARSRRLLVIATCLCIAAYLTRIVGIALALAAAISFLCDAPRRPLRKSARDAAILLGCASLVVAAWMGRNALARHQLPPTLREALSYERELVVANPSDLQGGSVGLKAFGGRLVTNGRYYAEMTARLLTSKRSARKALALVVVAGWACVAVWRRTSVEWYFAGYIAIYLIWPAHQGERFLVPALPLIYYYGLRGVSEAVGAAARLAKASGRARHIAVSGSAVAIALIFVVASRAELARLVAVERREPYHQGVMGEYIQALTWLGHSTPPDAVLVTNRAPYGVLWAERATYTVPWVADRDEILASVFANGVTHAVTNSFTAAYLGPVVDAHPEIFTPMKEFGSTRVYEVARPTP
jgi:hypothetical protein